MKRLYKLCEILRKCWNWLEIRAFAILGTALLCLYAAGVWANDAYDRGYADGYAAAGEPVIEYVNRFYEHAYIGNFNSELFHKSGCITLPDADKRVYFDDRTVAVGLGYRPCKNCDP